jgi:hypothetical protein
MLPEKDMPRTEDFMTYMDVHMEAKGDIIDKEVWMELRNVLQYFAGDLWIPFKKYKPRKDTQVLTYETHISVFPWGFSRSKMISHEFWSHKDQSFSLYEDEWTVKKFGFISWAKHRRVITHWMPYPGIPQKRNSF